MRIRSPGRADQAWTLIRPREAGGYSLDGQWGDDVHHALHAALTGERQGYYVDFGSLETLADVARETGTAIRVVGEITDAGYTIVNADGREMPLSPQAFDHFGGEATG